MQVRRSEDIGQRVVIGEQAGRVSAEVASQQADTGDLLLICRCGRANGQRAAQSIPRSMSELT